MKPKHGAVSPQERRVNAGRIEVRKNGDKRTIFGYATKFAPVQSSDLGGWVEEIHPNAFDDCLRSNPDVVALFNHDTNQLPLGRTTSGTLRLKTDRVGLIYEVDPPQTNLANDLMQSMDRGDIHQSSFGFYCIDESWRDGPDSRPIRTVLKAELFDVSPVTFPAYPDATSGVRASLRNAPAAIRQKIKAKRDRISELCADLDPDDEEYDELDCDERKRDNGESVTDPDGLDTSDEEDERCDCRCSACADDDRCEECSSTTCTSESCALCPAQQRSATVDLLIRRLRF
jgi:HK97 family phage prohead protease